MRKAKDDSFRRFQTESEAREFLISSLRPHFLFFEEVLAKEKSSGRTYRLDAVSLCETTGYFLGWEFKKSHLFKAEFAAVLKQAVDYRESVIIDPRLTNLHNSVVEACIVFPDWDGLHDNGEVVYALEADGMRLLASHFRVGALKQDLKTHVFHLIMGEQAIWHSNSGWTGNAHGVLFGKRRRGSSKAYD